jgi:dihydrofolate synthase / folylpolyglutamate synthase
MNYPYINTLNALAKKEYGGQNLGLSRIKKFLNHLKNPQDRYPVIHVAGTNGKGSTANMIQSILIAQGLKVALYTSPHFIDCNERIRINNQLIIKKDLERLLEFIFTKPAAKKLTYFEILTAVAFQYFAEKKIDVLVAEVGLGGRLDATNVVKNKIVSVITSIDFDHMEILGNDLIKIAKEKAGIIKKGVPTIIYTGHKKTDSTIKNICQEKKSPAFFLNHDFNTKYKKTDWLKQKQIFSYYGINSNYLNLELNFFGQHQIRNASLALACIELLKDRYEINVKAIKQGLKNVYWPGRFEIISQKIGNRKRTIILDGAHNIGGIKVFKNTLLNSPFGKNKIVLVLNILREKNYVAMCKELKSLAKKVIILKIPSPRALATEILVKEWQKYLPPEKIITIDNFKDLYRNCRGTLRVPDLGICEHNSKARNSVRDQNAKNIILEKSDTVIAVIGSLYAVALAKKYFKNISPFHGSHE